MQTNPRLSQGGPHSYSHRAFVVHRNSLFSPSPPSPHPSPQPPVLFYTTHTPTPTPTYLLSPELFTLTYGVLVTQILKDVDQDVTKANHELDKMGASIGTRILDEFLARTMREGGGGVGGRCKSFEEVGEVVARVGFKIFLGVPCSYQGPQNALENSFTLTLPDNPLSLFVELPQSLEGLHYSNILCGVIRGAYLAAGYKVECAWKRDSCLGDEACEIEVRLKEQVRDGPGEEFKME